MCSLQTRKAFAFFIFFVRRYLPATYQRARRYTSRRRWECSSDVFSSRARCCTNIRPASCYFSCFSSIYRKASEKCSSSTSHRVAKSFSIMIIHKIRVFVNPPLKNVPIIPRWCTEGKLKIDPMRRRKEMTPSPPQKIFQKPQEVLNHTNP